MRPITPELTPLLNNHFSHPSLIGYEEGFIISTFEDLIKETAKLSYLNKDYLLFFRGQTTDFKSRSGSSTFYPSIYRGDYVTTREVRNKFDILEGACGLLVSKFEENAVEGFQDVKRRKFVQWSILQHYEICDTPLLDFTHSLRVACSFAMMGNEDEFAYIYIFGLPYLSNRISINSEHEIVNIRLLSICPPSAYRPYFQEGYLVGTEDITTNYDSKTELDFNRRLIAKFRVPNSVKFWRTKTERIPDALLYPKDDPMFELCAVLRDQIASGFKTGDIGEFLKSWSKLEEWLYGQSKMRSDRHLSIRESLRLLKNNNVINDTTLNKIDGLRNFRNNVVHKPFSVGDKELLHNFQILEEVLGIIFNN